MISKSIIDSMKNEKGIKEWIGYMNQWESFIKKEFIWSIIDNILTGFMIGFLTISSIILWLHYFPELFLLEIIIFMLLIIDRIENT